ncbi:MAG: hypothetical protein DRN81_03810 [Thermoproteota archaeon]|nr:MAG: hypothetical protein DRN81_03810 [Candidatus Korarchaeota archaeon]
MSDQRPQLSEFETRPPLESFVKGNGLSPVQKVARRVSKITPVAGSILGAIAGTAVGAPTGPGALISGGLGTAAGTGAGIALGESIENLAGIQDETMEELAREAVVEPIKQGLIDVATAGTLKALAPVGRAVKGVGRGVFRIFVPKNATPKMFASVFKTSTKVSNKLKPLETSKELVKHGIHGDMDDMIRISGEVSGADGVLSKITRNAVGQMDEGIDISSALASLDNAADDATAVTPSVLKRLRQQVVRTINKGDLKTPSALEALDALDAERELERVGYDLLAKAADPRTGGAAAEVLEQKARLYIDTAASIGDEFDVVARNLDVVNNFKTPKIINQLKGISPRLAKQFEAAQNISDVRSIAAPFVRMGKLARSTLDHQGSAFIGSLGGKPSLTGFAARAITRPEAATAFAGAGQDISGSVIGQAGRGVSRAGQAVGRGIGATGDIIPRAGAQLFTQLGLTEDRPR